MAERNTLYADAIYNFYVNDEWVLHRTDGENETVLMIPMGLKNAPGLLGRIYIEDSNVGKIRARLFRETPKEKRTELIRTINKLNTIYRFVCFSIDDDGDIFATYDYYLNGDPQPVVEFTVSAFGMFVNIVDSSIPDLARTLWN